MNCIEPHFYHSITHTSRCQAHRALLELELLEKYLIASGMLPRFVSSAATGYIAETNRC